MPEELTTSDLARILKVIADETRLRILGELANGHRTGIELAHALELTPPTISHHMRKLVDAGIVTATSEAQRQIYTLNTSFLLEARRTPGTDDTGKTQASPKDERERVLRNFFEGDRLKSIPAKRKQRVIVLQHLMTWFDPSRSYEEREVNEILKTAYEDVATLRRELVDYGYMTRERGTYTVSRSLPERSARMVDEMPADEQDWFQGLISAAIATTQSDHHTTS
ncbi:MAG TPA: metalloregulator ArsR/SmtB family transcription factor [Thermomicrobiales bacterium]|nr:metalloregulator ArsR/SmtB family transcription factor [Thermomicrobiales bacterium]